MRMTIKALPVILAAMTVVGCGQATPMASAPIQAAMTAPATPQTMVVRPAKATRTTARPGQVSAQSRGAFSTYVEFEAGRLSFGKSEVANFLNGYGSYFDSFEFLKVRGGLLSATYRVYIYGHDAKNVDYVANALWSWIDRQSHNY
jgi:predicted small lipoprotein YifL